jgi:hypothetical protein
MKLGLILLITLVGLNFSHASTLHVTSKDDREVIKVVTSVVDIARTYYRTDEPYKEPTIEILAKPIMKITIAESEAKNIGLSLGDLQRILLDENSEVFLKEKSVSENSAARPEYSVVRTRTRLPKNKI